MVSIDSDNHNSSIYLLSPFEIDTSNLFRPVGELIGTNDDVNWHTFHTQLAREVLATSDCRAWRLKGLVPIKIVSVNRQTVLVEILNDFESQATEERSFSTSFFEGYETIPGGFFKIQILESGNSLMFELSEGPKRA